MKNRTVSRKLKFTVIMLAMALVTSVFAVGTLSKYSIGGGAVDAAVVAKWGVTIDIEGQNSFATEASNGAIVSSSVNNVVAPGTNSEEADGLMKVTLKGTPEVDFKLTIGLGEVEDIFLKNGTYPNYTAATVDGSRNNFNLPRTYYPVVFTFTHNYQDAGYSLAGCRGNSGVEWAEINTPAQGYTKAETFKGTLAQLNAFFANISTQMEHVNANYVLDDQFTLTWEWVFGDDANNKADTMLGNLAADKAAFGANLTDGTDYNLEVAYDFTIKIEQLD